MSIAFDHTAVDSLFTSTQADHAVIARVKCSNIRERQASVLEEGLGELARSNQGCVVLCVDQIQSATTSWISSLIELSDVCKAMGGFLEITGMSQAGPAFVHVMELCGAAGKLRMSDARIPLLPSARKAG